jgi:F-type H+-transporting ATPase subunit gamma
LEEELRLALVLVENCRVWQFEFAVSMLSGLATRSRVPVCSIPFAAQRIGGLQGSVDTQTRHAATLKAIAIRIKSVKSIQKITKAMKMVAAAKMRQDQRRLDNGIPFAKPVLNLFERLPREEKAGPVVYVGITSDKGLCGGVNSAVNKATRFGILEDEAKGNQVKYMGVGGKGVAGLKRLFGDRFSKTFEQVTKVNWNFATASLIAERIVEANPERLKMVGNTFKSMIAYDTATNHIITKKEAQGMDRSSFSKAMDVYSFEPSIYEVWDDLHEFYYGSALYAAYLNSAITEQAQRMTAMENASKNAGEMLEKLNLVYNRARQAKITTELCEIISGAAAV